MSFSVQHDKLYVASFEAFFLSPKEEEKSKYAQSSTVDLRSFRHYSLEVALEILINIPKKVYGHPLVNESIINFTISEYTLVNGEIPPHLMSAGTFGHCEVTRSDGDETFAALRNPT